MKGISEVIYSFSVLGHSFKNDRSFSFDHSRFLFIYWVIWCFWPKWNIFQSNYFLGSLVILEMLKYSCQFVTFKLIGHWVILCFCSFSFFWNNVFGHWVIWCFSQSFEQKLQPQILQPPSLQFFSLQQASLKPPSTKSPG